MSAKFSNGEGADTLSKAQFGMRAIFAAITAVALLSALAGVVLKQFSPDIRPRLVTFWGLWLAGLIGYLAIAFWQRRQAEREMGQVILQANLGGKSWRHPRAGWQWLLTLLFLLFSLLVVSLLVADMSTTPSKTDWFTLASPAMMVWLSARSITESLWLQHLQFCAHGILWGRISRFWDEIVEYRWSTSRNDQLEVFSIDDKKDTPTISAPVGAADRAAIAELLNEKLSGRARAPIDARSVSLGQLPLHELGKPHIRKHYFFLAFSVIIGLTLGFLGLILGTGTREFDGMVLFALYLFFLVGPSLRQGAFRRHTSPVARLFARRGILGFVVSALFALAIYCLAKNVFWWPAWFGYVFGLAYSYLTITAFGYYLWTRLDLCADIVFMPNALCWRWDTIQLRSWNRERGRLVLGRGWRSVIAYVPPEQRETVDSLLREKFAVPLGPRGEPANEASPNAIVQQ